MNKDKLVVIGKALANYYLDLYRDTNQVSLFIDKLTFMEICNQCQIPYRAVVFEMESDYPSVSLSRNTFKAIAVAAFQIAVSNDATETGVYDRLRKELSSLASMDNTMLMKRYFEEGQDAVWNSVKNYFSLNDKAIYKFPYEDAYGPGRYVRYPLSQQLISTSSLHRYADKFCHFLKPHCPYTYEEFKKRISFSYSNELIRHAVFAFYQNWNGETSSDYAKKRLTANAVHENNRYENVLTLNEKDKSFEIRRYEKSSRRKVIVQPAELYGEKPYKLFDYNEDYDDWSDMPLSDAHLIGLQYIGLLVPESPFSERLMIQASDAYKRHDSLFLVFSSEKTCLCLLNTLGISTSIELGMWFEGGVRLKAVSYLKDALPVLRFKKKQRYLYVNWHKIDFFKPVEHVRLADIQEIIRPGEYYLKLPGLSGIKISIAELSDDYSCDFICGWCINKNGVQLYQEKEDLKLILKGLNVTTEKIDKCVDEEYSGNNRLFVRHFRSFERTDVFTRGGV